MKKIAFLVLVTMIAAAVLSACQTPTPVSAPAPVEVIKTVIVEGTPQVIIEEKVVEVMTTQIVEVEKPAEMKVVRVGLSWNEKVHSLIQAWQDYMLAYSEEYGDKNGLKFEWIINVADGDPARQASNIEDLINQRVDVIIARAQDAAAICASIRAANQADIPFITFDRQANGCKPTTHVGADSYNQSISTSEEFVNILRTNNVEGKCIELQGDLLDMNAVYRSRGWQEVEARENAWTTLVQVPTEWKPEKFMSGLANALQAHPDANCLFVASDFAFTSVQSALEDAGKWAPVGDPNHVWVAAQDVNPQGYDAMLAGYIDVATTYDAYFHAVEAVNAAGRAASGDILQPFYLVPGRVATSSTLADMDYIWAKDYKD